MCVLGVSILPLTTILLLYFEAVPHYSFYSVSNQRKITLSLHHMVMVMSHFKLPNINKTTKYGLGLWCLTPLSLLYFSYIVAVSFIGNMGLEMKVLM